MYGRIDGQGERLLAMFRDMDVESVILFVCMSVCSCYAGERDGHHGLPR